MILEIETALALECTPYYCIAVTKKQQILALLKRLSDHVQRYAEAWAFTAPDMSIAEGRKLVDDVAAATAQALEAFDLALVHMDGSELNPAIAALQKLARRVGA